MNRLHPVFVNRVPTAILNLVLIALVPLTACNGGKSTSTPTLQSLAVTPSKPSIAVGGTQQLTATATYSDGTTNDATATVSWSSSNNAVATISASGLATGVSAGQVSFSASNSGVTGSVAATVSKVLKSIMVNPSSVTGVPGATAQLTATGTYNDGSTGDISSSATWTSATPGVATVNNAGVVTFVGAGSDTVTASLNSVTGSAALSVAPLAAQAVSNNNPIPLTPISITTTGLNPSAPVSVQFSDSSGFNVAESAVRVAPDGTVIAAVPLYLDASSGSLSSGTVAMTLTQGGQTTTPQTINIQTLPTVASYGVQPGQITHAMLILQALQLSQSLNAMEALGSAQGSQVDTSSAVASLKTQLIAAIEARSDVDRVAADSTTVIPAATLTDGTTLQFDSTTLDLMDRVHAVFLSQAFGSVALQAQAAAIAAAPGRAAARAHRVGSLPVRASRQSAVKLASLFKGGPARPTLGNPNSQLGQILLAIEGLNTAAQLPLQVTKALDPKTVAAAGGGNPYAIMDQISAIASGLDAVNKLMPDPDKFGAYTALLSAASTAAHCLIDDGMYVYAGITGDSATQALIVQDMAQNQKQAIDALFTLAPAIPGLGAIQPAVEVASSVWGYYTTVRDYYELANGDSAAQSQAQSDASVAIQAAQQDGAVFSSSNPGMVEITGQATLDSNLGQQAPDAGIELNPGPASELDTLADPSGNFEMFVPLADPSFNYSSVDFSMFDPVAGTVLSSENVDLSHATSATPLTIPPITGTCNDSDINNPDGDDPDCD